MYIRKDIQKTLRLEARMAEGSHCLAWAKLFRECAYLLRKQEKRIAKLEREIVRMREDAAEESI